MRQPFSSVDPGPALSALHLSPSVTRKVSVIIVEIVWLRVGGCRWGCACQIMWWRAEVLVVHSSRLPEVKLCAAAVCACVFQEYMLWRYSRARRVGVASIAGLAACRAVKCVCFGFECSGWRRFLSGCCTNHAWQMWTTSSSFIST